MTHLHLLWHDYRYFPYERTLAQREAALAFGKSIQVEKTGFAVPQGRAKDALHLTYFKAVQNESVALVPDQAKLEASGKGAGWDPSRQPIPSLHRQSTRYSAHGLHEYRGKFNPQVVRAIGNLLELSAGSWILDPFCGSGTTLLESAHIGWNALGIDVNPLGELIANSKVTAFNIDPALLSQECDELIRRLARAHGQVEWRESLPDPDYLEQWFPVRVLEQLGHILLAIEKTSISSLRNVFRVILSDICREVSFQDPADLRVRRRKNPADNYPAMEKFIEALESRVASIIRARQHVQPKAGTRQIALHGDSKNLVRAGQFLREHKLKSFDAAITSPPYATAMPYLDTQRLSLSLLDLLGRRQLRSEERQLIGNREITEKERSALEGALQSNAARLPEKALQFCRRLLHLADDPAHGFRRRNVPALAYKYLADMRCMFASVGALIRPRGQFALVVGRNTTNLRGEEVLIDTPALLASIAESQCWEVEETLTLDTYQRFDLHSKNSIREEALLMLRRAA